MSAIQENKHLKPKNMKVDLNRRFRGFKGNELDGDNVATAVAEALFNYGKDKPVGRDEKFKAYVLCQRIIKAVGSLRSPPRRVRLSRRCAARA